MLRRQLQARRKLLHNQWAGIRLHCLLLNMLCLLRLRWAHLTKHCRAVQHHLRRLHQLGRSIEQQLLQRGLRLLHCGSSLPRLLLCRLCCTEGGRQLGGQLKHLHRKVERARFSSLLSRSARQGQAGLATFGAAQLHCT